MRHLAAAIAVAAPWWCSAFRPAASSTSYLSPVHLRQRRTYQTGCLHAQTLAPVAELDAHIDIDEEFFNLTYLHRSPDVILVDQFLSRQECESIVSRARNKGLSLSPVAYAGWTQDAQELLKLAAGGPAVWLALARVWMVNGDVGGLSRTEMIVQAGSTWALAMAAIGGMVALYTQQRIKQLQSMRTSTSTTLDGTGLGDAALVRRAMQLLKSDWRTFEAPTVIHYDPGQKLAPHFDANRAATVEDATRGGQTLCTLLVYCNDVQESDGGATVFNRLGFSVRPKQGQALLFFPATKEGAFDERVEHEGAPAKTEKWVARIWRHQDRVTPPYGLPDHYNFE